MLLVFGGHVFRHTGAVSTRLVPSQAQGKDAAVKMRRFRDGEAAKPDH